jgi:glycosyltransferase involved in cell wall biosynthesis
MSFKLTIAVPTYNRSEILRDNLENIFSIVDKNIQIVVSDNCSNDNTEYVCKKYFSFNNFTYTKNDKNVGYDLNVLNCINNSLGDYIWFVADDDSITKSVFEEVLSAISGDNLAGLLIDATVIDPDTNKIIHNSLSHADTDHDVVVDESILVENFKWSTLISSQVVRREDINISDLDKAVGTVFIQLPLFWNSCFGKKIRLISSEKIIKHDALTNNFGSSTASIWLWNLISVSKIMIENGIDTGTMRLALTSIYSKGLVSKSGVLAHYFISRTTGEGQVGLAGYFCVCQFINITMIERVVIFCLSLIPDSFIRVIHSFLRGKF